MKKLFDPAHYFLNANVSLARFHELDRENVKLRSQVETLKRALTRQRTTTEDQEAGHTRH
jgi:hypothetical protein